jgi:hypothetical protein
MADRDTDLAAEEHHVDDADDAETGQDQERE